MLSLLVLMPFASASVTAQQPAGFCQPGQVPGFVFGFAALKAQLGDTMGQPVECEHPNSQNGDTLQQTTTGLAFYRKSTNIPTFTDGTTHWAITPDGLVDWTGPSPDPPGFAPPPTPVPTVPPPGSSPDHPIGLGQPVTLHDGWRLSVQASNLNATQQVTASNGGQQPPPGTQYVLAAIEVTNTGTAAARFDRYRLRSIGSGGVIYTQYDNSCGAVPNVLPSTEVVNGNTLRGNVCWAVNTGDVPTLVMYDDASLVAGRPTTYFALR